jgi:site-specific recombinase XerD
LEPPLLTGIRQSEYAAITLGDIQLHARVSRDEGNVGSLRVHGKGRKDRVVTFNYKACRALRVYLAIQPKVDQEQLIFTGFEKSLGTRSIRTIVGKYLAEAGIAGASQRTAAPRFIRIYVKSGKASGGSTSTRLLPVSLMKRLPSAATITN